MTAVDNTEEEWTPLELQEHEVETFTALRDDVPPWLYSSLWEWIWQQFSVRRGGSIYDSFNTDLARTCERTLRVTISDQGPYAHGDGLRAVMTTFRQGPVTKVWRLVDFLLSQLWASSDRVKAVDRMLVEAGSGWRVGMRAGKKPGLVRRLPEGVKAAAEEAFQKPNAGKRLATAWEDAFGVNPDPSKAYWFAVKAVEDASAPVVIPNDTAPTLGKVISRIEQGGQFNLPHLRQDPRAMTHDVLLGLLRMLWVGQYDRHGGMPQSPLPDDVTQAEAESALMLAVTLVSWFETGKVQR